MPNLPDELRESVLTKTVEIYTDGACRGNPGPGGVVGHLVGTDAAEAEEIAPARQEPKKSRYDFFTVLPEMEVVVPEADLNERSRAQTRAESSQDANTTAPPPTADAVRKTSCER